MKYLLILFIFSISACSTTRYYVVRHAERAVVTKDSAGMMASNPPLSEAGKVRSFVLRNELQNKHIQHIYSTNTIRTTTTAEPLSQKKNIKVEIYSNIDSLVNRLKSEKGNALIVGHSNTVDDIVNKIIGRKEILADFKDTEYDNLFIIKRKKGQYQLSRKKYGYPSNPE
ncbi:MAG: histidine phosphatase family protein [Bacteroidota bacterium]